MYEKILVAIDTSAIGDRVFDTALKLAKIGNSNLMLVHILSEEAEESPISFWPMNIGYDPEMMKEYHQLWEKFEQECLQMLQSKASAAKDVGFQTEFTQVRGNPGREICKLAQEWSADLIVMGRRGHSVFSELVLGSVSNYVIHRAHCSVHVVQD
ncbi:MAG: universal stress protein [Okeania sp. SIO2F4]|uniref:universal stress protein n=1 Tax=Okeania sp. SIO2F4 TaxID=2607790 RepID=UPI0014298FC9|nr:universal stress protein [Okeania sp. SIO2F4]NES02705.1 universal stress protein [Okeania sp. SIO2F4]